MNAARIQCIRILAAIALSFAAVMPSAAVSLSDAPLFSTINVPGNLALVPSVEYPTALSVANVGDYVHANEYLGYFDPKKCYVYNYISSNPDSSYFKPAGKATNHTCSGKWSGNFMNWLSMPTIDPFRWALTGGYRATDTASLTILQKAYASKQGSAALYPDRGTFSLAGGGHSVPRAIIPSITPFPSWTDFNARIWGEGVNVIFSIKDSEDYRLLANPRDLKHYGSGTSAYNNYFFRIRVGVCDDSSAAGGLEANCVRYPGGVKPEGLIQKYSNKIRYSILGYLKENGANRQGGVLRAEMGFVGPKKPDPLSSVAVVNPLAEWDASNGVMKINPDAAAASASAVANSGVMNYLNKFGNYSSGYMAVDNVSELYYAAIRYFQKRGNVPQWYSGMTATSKDGFPVATTWRDPILYSCQKNFILGIGDTNTHYDINTAGNGGLTNADGTSRPMPPLVASDTFNKSMAWTKLIEQAEGGDVAARNAKWGSHPGSEFIAGLAYGNHVYDMRPDLPGKQTIDTYWMDVMELQYAQDRNPYWLAAKYGGFKVPSGFNPAVTPSLPTALWSGGDNITMYTRLHQFEAAYKKTRPRPSNYFLAGDAGKMVAGLNNAFSSIAAASVSSYSTAVMPSSNVMSASGTTSYSANYDTESWSGTVKAATFKLGSPLTDLWSSDSKLASQFGGAGWNTGRVIITWDKNSVGGAKAVPFRLNSLSTPLKTALDTTYVSGNDSSNYLNYLRGDKSNEVATATGLHVYRTRTRPLGDIVNSKLTLSGAPKMPYSDAYNPGYAAFKLAKASRIPLVLFGANDGMLHALNGSATGANAGKEVFAYVPGQVFYGPDGTTTAQASTNGLAAIGNPNYVHRYYVDATPQVFDVDFKKTHSSTLISNTWKTIVVGGLGKGGKGFYAIDITDPSGMNAETSAASKVLWEISNTTPGFETLGYSYGAPIMVKTVKYGWTLILTSGYNNSDDKGYLFLVNPANGALLEKISTVVAAPGLTQASAFINDYTDGVADAVYVGDLNGKLWRFDLTKTSGSYDAPKVLFQTASPDGGTQPITVAPIPEVHVSTRARTILFGTGQLLDSSDAVLTKEQSLYAVTDGDNQKFEPIVAPLMRSDLTGISSLTINAGALPASSRGWYYDLGKTSGTAWRVVLNSAAADGVALFTATLTSADACNPAGKGRAYAVDYSRGYTVLKNPSNPNSIVPYVDIDSAPRDNVLVKDDGALSGLVGDEKGKITQLQLNTPGALLPRLINWRDINAVN